MSTLFSRAARLAPIAAIAALGLACAPDYSQTELSTQVYAELEAGMNVNQITVPEGGVLKVHISSTNTKNESMANAVSSDDPSIMEVHNVVSDHDFAFFGNKPGTTHVAIRANDEVVLIVQAVVTPQPAE